MLLTKLVFYSRKEIKVSVKNTWIRNLFYSKKVAPYIFVAPFVITFFLFFAYPLLSTLLMSFQEVLPGATKYIGLANYKKLNDPDFFKAIYNSTKYTFWTLVFLVPFPLIFAVFLNSKLMKFSNFFRSSLFIPILTSVVVAGTIFRLMFGELPGSLFNTIAGYFGAEPQKWILHSTFVLVILAFWRYVGINIVYFLSALQSIPQEIYEAAEIDGAGKFDAFKKITLPYLKPVTIYVLTISIFGGFAMFTESFVVYSGNHSPNGIGLTMIGYIYLHGIEFNDFGFGSAIGLTLFVIVMLINIIQLKFFGMFKREDS